MINTYLCITIKQLRLHNNKIILKPSPLEKKNKKFKLYLPLIKIDPLKLKTSVVMFKRPFFFIQLKKTIFRQIVTCHLCTCINNIVCVYPVKEYIHAIFPALKLAFVLKSKNWECFDLRMDIDLLMNNMLECCSNICTFEVSFHFDLHLLVTSFNRSWWFSFT